jgi:hypothetical protein
MLKTNPSFLQILPNKKTLYFVLLTVLIGLSGVAFSLYLKVGVQAAKTDGNQTEETTAQQCPTCRPPTPQVIYAPLFNLSEASSSEIVLNCRSSHPIEAVPTFYTDEGTPIVGEAIQLKPGEMRFVDVMNLIPADERNRHKWGGMSLSYSGNFMEVWAQLTMHDVGKNGSTNVLFVVVNAPRSNVREAVWRMPKNATATIALGNYSDSLTVATLTYSNGETEQVNIAPYATEIVKRRNNGQNQSNAEAESVRIESSGEPGRLITTGLVVSNNRDFASSIRFYDPQNVSQPNLYATNFRLKDSTPYLILKNTTADAVTARPRFLPAAGEGSGVIELPMVTIPANAVKEVNLNSLVNAAKTRTDLASVSVQIINSGAAGSLIGAVNTTNNVTKVDYDIPLRDSGLRSSAGGYTVRLDDDYSTILSITNVGDKIGKFTMQVNFDGGFYALYPQEIAPGATTTFDIGKLRDEQTPDSENRRLPRNLTMGQIRWSLVGGSVTRLIGRSEVISRSDKVSSSYSCGVCCQNSYANSRITPDLATAYFTDTSQFAAQQQDEDCYGNWFPWYPVTATWSADDYELVHWWMPNGQITALEEEGNALITATWEAERFIENSVSYCEPHSVTAAPIADLFVRPAVEILRNNVPINSTTRTPNTQTVIVGQEINLSTRINRSGTVSSRQWTVPGTRIEDYKVICNRIIIENEPVCEENPNNNISTSGTVTELTNFADPTIKYYWVDGGDGLIVEHTVTINQRPYTARARFNVKRPTAAVTTVTDRPRITNTGAGEGLYFGSRILGTPGISFSASAQIPTGFNGEFQWVQIWNKNRQYVRIGSRGNVTAAAVGNGLDTIYPYEIGLSASDTPGMVFDPLFRRVTIDESFQMYFMFRPTGLSEPTIPVPVQVVNWSWYGDASSSDGVSWVLNPSSTNTRNPTGVNTTSYPRWTRNAYYIPFRIQ